MTQVNVWLRVKVKHIQQWVRVKGSSSVDPHKCVTLICVCVCAVPAEKDNVTDMKSYFVCRTKSMFSMHAAHTPSSLCGTNLIQPLVTFLCRFKCALQHG